MKLKFLIILPLIFLLAGCNGNGEDLIEVPAPKVKVLDLSEDPNYEIHEVGEIKAVQEVELIAKASGTISQISKKIGEPVEVGEVLAVIDYDEANNPARVNYENAQLQLVNAQQNYDEILANNQTAVTQSRLRVQTLESTLGRLQRNLEELEVSNNSTEKTLALQLQNAEKNADTADVNYNKITAQFEQSWQDLLNSTKTSLDGVFINLDTGFSSMENILNPKKYTYFTASQVAKGLGDRDSIQRNSTVNHYNDLRDDLDKYQLDYERELPLTEDSLADAVQVARSAAEEVRSFVADMRLLLQNSIVRGDLTQTNIDAYTTQISTVEATVLAQVSAVDALEKTIASFKLDRTSQIATADNNRIIASNQLADAQNAVTQFKTTSFGAVKDLETQIAQTSNELLSAQADMAAAYRSAGISASGKDLELDTLENQLKLAEKSLDDNQIASSIDGVLSEFAVDEGDYVSPGTFLGRVVQSEQVKVTFYASEDNANKITLGQDFTFKLTDNGSRLYTGVINKIAPTADPQNKKILIEGSVVNDEMELKPGTFITLNLDLSGETFNPDKVYVPMNSIIFGQNDQYVYVLREGEAVRQNVEIYKVYGMWVEVTKGLTKKDTVVIEGHRNLPPNGGTLVEIIK